MSRECACFVCDRPAVPFAAVAECRGAEVWVCEACIEQVGRPVTEAGLVRGLM